MANVQEVQFVISADGQQAIRVSKEVSDAYKQLKATSIAELQMQKQSAVDAYETIRNSGVASAEELQRAEAAKAKAIGDINAKLESDHEGMLSRMVSSIKTNYLLITGIVIAAYETISKAWHFAEEAAAVEEQKQALNSLASQFNTTANEIVASVKNASNSMITQADAVRVSAKALMMGLNPQQLVEFMRVVEATTNVTGQKVGEAFESLVQAAATGKERALKNMGVIVDLGSAYEKYAASVGKSADELDMEEKQLAGVNAILAKSKETLAALGEQGTSTADRMEQFTVMMADFKEMIGLAIIKGAELAVVALGSLGAAFYSVTGGISWALTKLFEIASKVPGIGRIFDPLVKAGKEVTDWLFESAKAAETIVKTAWGAFKGGEEELKRPMVNLRDGLKDVSEMGQKAKQAIADIRTELSGFDRKIADLNPDLDEATKDLQGFWFEVQKFMDKIDKQKEIPLSEKTELKKEALDKYYAYAKARREKEEYDERRAFDELISGMLDARRDGVAKDLAAVDQWLYESAMKIKGNAGMLATLMLEADRRRLAVMLDNEKKLATTQLNNLTKYRDQLVKTYSDAIAKANEYYATAKKAGDLSKSIGDYLAGLNASRLSPEEQMLKEKQSALDALKNAGSSGDLGQMQKAFEQARAFLDKYKGMKDLLGFSMDFSEVVEGLGDLKNKVDSIERSAESAGDAWMDYANASAEAIGQVDQQIYDLEVRIDELDVLIAKTRSIDVQTAQAKAAIQEIQNMLNSLSDKTVTVSVVGGAYDSYSDYGDYESDGGGGYAGGTSYVPKTGPYLLHEGEAVLTKTENQQRKMTHATSNKSSSPQITLSPTIVIQGSEKSGADLAREIDAELAHMIRYGRSEVGRLMK